MLSSVVRFLRKLLFSFEGDRFRRELAEEIETHQALKRDEHSAAGLSPREAAEHARRDMGNTTSALEQSADARTFVALDDLLQDARHTLRLMRKNLGFSLVAIASLALGIAGNTAVFSVLNALLIRPLPFGEPQQLVRVTEFFPKALLVHFRERSRTMDLASFGTGQDLNLTGEGPASRITASSVSANLFSLLQVSAEVGRTFQAHEDQPGRDSVVILSHRLWRERFHSDPAVIGRMISVNGMKRTIVGVMPARFSFPTSTVQLWIPAAVDPRQQVDYWAGEFTPIVGRLLPGATIEQARNEIRSLTAGVWQMFPWPMPRNWNATATVIPLQTDLAGDSRSRVLILLCCVGVVLVIACANVAGLLSARGAARVKELAMRGALGAGQSRIVRQLLTESLVLAGAAGILGFAAGGSAVHVFSTVVSPDLPTAASAGIDWNVASFTALLSLAAGIAFGLAPAMGASRLNILGALKAGGRSASLASIRFRNWLIAGEIALTFALVVAASLLILSLGRVLAVDPGFATEGVLTVKISPDPSFCKDPAACVSFYDRVLDQARRAPKVIDVAVANAIPFDGSVPSLAVDVEDHPKTADFPAPMFWAGAVSPGYMQVLGIPLVAGRLLTPADSRESEPVVLISASTARRFWPGQSAIGKHIKRAAEQRWRTVVGVVADVRQHSLTNPVPGGITGAMYMPYAQAVDGKGRLPEVMNLVVKTARHAPGAADELHRLTASVNPNIPVSRARPLQDLVAASVSALRSTTWLLLAFASLALALASIGVYGLVSYSVTQRAYEIALRMAIGAKSREILAMILMRSVRIAILGLCLGTVAALLAGRGLSRLLFEVAFTDPLVYACVAAFLLSVVIIASMLPAWHASRIDPVRLLRAE